MNFSKLFKFYKIYSYIFIFILSFITSLALNSSLFSDTLHYHDSSMFQYFGYAMKKGLYMYTDIFDHKGPILFLLNYISMFLGGNGLFFLEYIYIYIFFLYVYKTSLLYLNDILSIITIVTVSQFIPHIFQGGNLSETYAISFIMIALYTFAKYFINNYFSKYELIILGSTFSLVLLIRINMISVWCAFIFVILIKLFINKEYYKILNYMVYFSIGCLIIIIPVTIYLYITNSLLEAVYQSFTYNILYLKSSDISTFDTIYYQLLKPEMVIFLTMICVCYIINKNTLYEYTVYFSIIISFISVFLSRRHYSHYLVVLIPLCAVLLILILKNIKNINNNYTILKILVGVCISISPLVLNNFIIISSINLSSSNTLPLKVERIQYDIAYRESTKKSIKEISDYIKNHTNKNDRIYCHRISGIIYLQSDRLSNTKYFNLPAVDITNNKIIVELFEELEKEKAKLIITYKSFMDTKQIGFERDLQQYINDNYMLDYINDTYYIYKLNSK